TGGGYSSNGSDFIDSEEEEGIVDQSLLDDVDRVDVEGEGESPINSTKPAASPNGIFPCSSSPRTSRTSTGSSGGRSLLQRRIKVEAEEETSDIYPNCNFSISPNDRQYQSHSNSIVSSTYSSKHITAATLSDLDGIDMMNIPVDLADTSSDAMQINIDNIKSAPELMQETHVCFFSLIRDVICSTPDHRMALSTLEDRVKTWQENPITPLNDWYCISNSWLGMLTSAISFLSGDFPDHRDEMTTKPVKDEELEEETDVPGEERVVSPPPPRCPTNWVVHASSAEEKECFREQERLRYENPHRAFTFRMHNYESVVGPVKGVYNQSIGMNKPRGHSLLVAERPNFVTILALERLHQQQQGMAKTKKSSSQRKANRSKQSKDSAPSTGKEPATTLVTTSTVTTTHIPATSTESSTVAISLPSINNSTVQSGIPAVSTAAPIMSPAKTTPARAPRTPLIQRTYTLAPGQNVQNLQVTTPQTVLAGKSLLTTPATQQQITPSSSVVKTVAVTTQTATQVSTNAATPILKTVTLTHQQMQAMNAARGITVASLRDPNSGVAVRMPAASIVGNITTSSSALTSDVTSSITTVVSSPSVAVPQQKAPVMSRTTVQPSVSSPKALVNVTSPQLVNVSQVSNFVTAGKTLVTTGLSGMKLVNAMKADGSQQQTIFIKQPQTDQQPQAVIGNIQQQPQLLQHANKVSFGGKPIPVTHMSVQQPPQQPQTGSGQPVTGPTNTAVMKQQPPMVAKVLTSAQGQVISMESLMAHQKQHGTLPQGTALRVTAGGKPGQTSLIQIPNSTQFAVVSQGNLLSVGQSRVLQTQLPNQQVRTHPFHRDSF
ncbi:hypothetical protein C0J52_24317, partial [Blattella germanica]